MVLALETGQLQVQLQQGLSGRARGEGYGSRHAGTCVRVRVRKRKRSRCSCAPPAQGVRACSAAAMAPPHAFPKKGFGGVLTTVQQGLYYNL